LLLMVVSFGLSGCALFRSDDGASAEAYSPIDGSAGEAQTFDNATEAILATRSESTSERVRELEKLFTSGDYAASLKAARVLVASAEAGGEELDAAVFIEAASLYYLGQHAEAQAPLNRHRSEFPQSRYAESSEYYVASNRVKRRQWRAGADGLDAFARRYPESLLMEFVLYDLASARHALGDYDRCLELAQRIGDEFVYSKIIDRAAVLKGDVLKRRGEFAQSEAAFLAAKNAAEAADHPRVAARALRYLIEVSAAQGRWKDSAAYYETFFRKYSDSSQAPAAALAGLAVMKELGTLDAGLDRMEAVLVSTPEGVSARAHNRALRSYADYFRELHGPGALMRRLGNLSSSGRGSERFRQQLIIARLEVLENHFPERAAEIRVFYDEVRTRMARRDMSVPTLLKIGRHVAKSDLREGAVWFREVLARPGSDYKAEAALGLAKVLAASSDPAEMAEAAGEFRKVVESYGSPALEEEAVLGLARLAVRGERWAEARDYWAAYVANGNWQLARQEAGRGFETARQRAGGLPASPQKEKAKPIARQQAVSAAPSAATHTDGRRLMLKVRQAERIANSGMKEQAYEILKKVIEDGSAIEEPDEATGKALRAAIILKENLGLELAGG